MQNDLDKPKDAPAVVVEEVKPSKVKHTKDSEGSEYKVDEHKLSWPEFAQRLEITLDTRDPAKSIGLTSAEASARLEKFGKNRLKPAKGKPEWLKFLLLFVDKFMLLLEIAGVLCFISYGLLPSEESSLILGCVLFGIVIFLNIFTYFQNRNAGRAMASFKSLLPPSCRVMRDGQETRIAAEDLVPGDVVIVQAGDKVPADIRLILADEMKVDNSSLTGESEPQPRTVECTDELAMETENIAFYSTLVLNGRGRGVVFRTGDNTLIGKIANLATGTGDQKSTLQKEIGHFVRFVSILAISMGIIYFCISIGLQLGQNSGGDQSTTTLAILAVVNTIGIIVANIPEGLPGTVTLCLTIAARRMARKNVFVKKLDSIETLGSCTAIASDKTGTLTQNRMTAAHMMYEHEILSCDFNITKGKFDPSNSTCAALIRIAANCNKAIYDSNPENLAKPIFDRTTIGDASESALLRFCHQLEDIEVTRARAPEIFGIPFNSVNKFQLSIHRIEGEKNLVLLFKGAPERVFDRCTHVLINGKLKPIDESEKAAFESSYETLGSMGERVLGFAQLVLPPEYTETYPYSPEKLNFPTEGLVFVGLISLIDPPRESVPGAILKCKGAGIRVIMVTGDHPITAKAIAKSIGIIWDETDDDIAKRKGIKKDEALRLPECNATVVKGSDIPDFDDSKWDAVLSKRQIVFARTSPQQKLQIVENLQSRGEIVLVTGDGVNDSPALKKADVGCAMGIVGSDVSKEAAKIILMDDSFGSIVAGIEEGRLIFDNLKKSIAYTLTHLMPEIMPFLVSINGNVPAMLASIIIIFIDMGTELVPATSLAYETVEADIMLRAPRNPLKDRMVSKKVLVYAYLIGGFIETGACFAAALYVYQVRGYPAYTGILARWPPGSDYHHPACDQLCSDDYYVQQTEYIAIATFFAAIVQMQMWNIVSCKTRKVSLFTHGMRNSAMNVGFFVSAGIVFFVVYIPGLNNAVSVAPILDAAFYAIPLPFGAFLLFYNEMRKLIGRKKPDSWVEKYLNW